MHTHHTCNGHFAPDCRACDRAGDYADHLADIYDEAATSMRDALAIADERTRRATVRAALADALALEGRPPGDCLRYDPDDDGDAIRAWEDLAETSAALDGLALTIARLPR